MTTKPLIYMDHAAATPMDDAVLAAMLPYFSEKFYNPSAIYLSSKQVSADLHGARKSVAKWLGCQPGEIFFTAGGTEANNLAIQGVMRAHPGANLVLTAIEHDSVIQPGQMYDHKTVQVNTEGQVDLKQLKGLIDDQTVLVSVMYANNEIGSLQPLSDVAKIISQIKGERRTAGNDLPLYLHTDACQAAAYLNLQVHRLGVDLLTLNGGKIYGPKQSGILFIKAGTKLDPLIVGGGQENSLRSGTENVPAIIGFAQALELVQSRRQVEAKRLEELQAHFFERLTSEIPSTVINGNQKQRLCNNIHVTFTGQDNERLLMALDEKGIMCASGSACNASSDQPSHVLQAIGLDEAAIRSSLRFTIGQPTTKSDIDYVVDQLKALISGGA